MSLRGEKKEESEKKEEEKKDSAESSNSSTEESSEAEKPTRLNLAAMTARPTAPTLAAALAPAPPSYVFVDLTNNDRLIPDDFLNSQPSLPYENLLAVSSIGSYRLTHRDGYITFALNVLNNRLPENKKYREKGLKIHISLDDEEEGNIKRGWNAIVNILRYYNIARSKVVQVEGEDSIEKDNPADHPTTCGKQITIYASLHSDGSDWRNVLESITQALDKAKVTPGYETRGSRRINCYLSYRYDLDPNTGKRWEGENEETAFPPRVHDPIEGIGQSLTDINRSAKPSSTVPRPST